MAEVKAPYMTTAEFARRIGMHPQTVRRWDKDGSLKAHHKTMGGVRYYSEEQVEAFLHGDLNVEKNNDK